MLGLDAKELKSLEVCEILKRELPLCFINSKNKKPLKLDIYQDLRDYYQQETRFNTQDLYRALKIYLSTPEYLAGLTLGANRVDLWGSPVDQVTADQAQRASWLLSARKNGLISCSRYNHSSFGIAITPAVIQAV